ncbi:MAG TPA: phosphocholine cytidylyltransferase family protein [Blastocatellia bacterium]
MRALILAAGSGLRLNGICGDTPKCLLEIGAQTLLNRQVECLRLNGIDEITVVVGYKAERVRRHASAGLHFVENEYYSRTNSLYSLWLAREELADGFVVLNSDVLFHPALLATLLDSPYEDALLVSFHQGGVANVGDEEMKVKVGGGRVREISKSMQPEQSDGENVGIAKFGPDGARLLLPIINDLISAGRYSEWAPRAFQEFAFHRPLYAIGTEHYPWIEIDFPADYVRALTEVFPDFAPLDEGLRQSAATVSAIR